jgi:hypothetical protein
MGDVVPAGQKNPRGHNALQLLELKGQSPQLERGFAEIEPDVQIYPARQFPTMTPEMQYLPGGHTEH